MDLSEIRKRYDQDGFVSPISILDEQEAQKQRRILEHTEADVGNLHYKFKIHTAMPSAFEVATNPKLLDAVETILGPNILLYSVSYIIKEPHSASHVSWHQDLTYWGLSCDDQVSAWLALSPATMESGCMRMIPGSHLGGKREHQLIEDENNVLLNGQNVIGVDEKAAVYCPLSPGEVSLHHGWTLHASMPNISHDRRIGLNIQYLAPHVRQLKNPEDGAILVRGEDHYNNFPVDMPATKPNDPAQWAYRQKLSDRIQNIQSTTI
ncbi:phytanoyl-CoA dioxygenase family protein [Curvivirga aplysinae]|uniref:phytanoyl-CoA dioxygenase family protein n=1 Tax=Curvivirga aplysinae TaxID=2529852 RepID=UPI0012BC67D8|nr:phytanoyl-CoA dioxygenase family protein [Curvivirga aplysinae]MTI08241.1 phytanoyl-CoA dioxygenase family protein [Curvivirga aplysinae]